MDVATSMDFRTIAVIYVLEGMASLLTSREQPEKALKLLAWADASRERINDPRPENEQLDVDEDIVAIREMIDEEIHKTVYAEGKAMTIDQVVAYALDDDS